MREPSSGRQRHGPPLIVPLLLILAGLYLLAPRLGLSLPNIMPLLLRFWPLLLIVIGLELLISRWRRGIGLALGMLLAAGLIGGLYAAGQIRLDGQPIRSLISHQIDDARRAEISLDVGASALKLSALPAESMGLAEGFFESRYLRLAQRAVRHDESASLELDTAGGGFFMPGRQSTLELKLSPRVPLVLLIDAGASEFTLDLSALRVEQLMLETGASDGTLILPGREDSKVTIDAGAASLTVVVPPTVGARITVESSASSIQVENQRLTRDGDIYQTSGSNGTMVEVEIKSSAASITIR